MFSAATIKIKEFFTTGHERSLKAKKNIIASFIIKGLSIAVNFLLVPITLNYLNPTKYGIWITLYSIVGWFSFFDIGLGNGLRNKLAEALAKGETDKARIYISTTYGILSFIIAIVFILFVIANRFLDWTALLNTPKELGNELSLLVLIVFGFFCIRFVLQLIGMVLTADQKPSYTSLFNLCNNLLALIIIIVLTKTTNGSLLYLGTAITLAPVVIYTLANFYFFNKNYKQYTPSFKYFNLSYSKELINLGSKFFIIQISALVLFSTDNVIITQIFDPSYVTPYNISFKYFSVIVLIFGIINSPFWSAYTEAYVKNDIGWIKRTTKKIQKVWLLLTVVSLVMLAASGFVYKIWIGNKVTIPFVLSSLMCLYVIVVTWGSIFVSFINGIGKVKLQLIYSIVAGILNIPLSIIFAKYLNLGTAGVILATIICLTYGPIVAYMQFKKIINGKATGIWFA